MAIIRVHGVIMDSVTNKVLKGWKASAHRAAILGKLNHVLAIAKKARTTSPTRPIKRESEDPSDLETMPMFDPNTIVGPQTTTFDGIPVKQEAEESEVERETRKRSFREMAPEPEDSRQSKKFKAAPRALKRRLRIPRDAGRAATGMCSFSWGATIIGEAEAEVELEARSGYDAGSESSATTCVASPLSNPTSSTLVGSSASRKRSRDASADGENDSGVRSEQTSHLPPATTAESRAAKRACLASRQTSEQSSLRYLVGLHPLNYECTDEQVKDCLAWIEAEAERSDSPSPAEDDKESPEEQAVPENSGDDNKSACSTRSSDAPCRGKWLEIPGFYGRAHALAKH